MKRKIKLEIGLVVLLLLFATITSISGTNINNTILSPTQTENITNVEIISIPDSNVVVTVWTKQHENGQDLPFYSISLDGGKTIARTVQPEYVLGLRYAYFDPLVDVPVVEPTLSAGTDTHLFIVQFVTQPLEEYKEAITTFGGTVYQYIAQFAYLVEMSDVVKQQVESLPYVRWVGPYHPAYKLEEYMIDNFENADETYPSLRYNIQVHTVEMKHILADKIQDIGGVVNTANGGKVLVQATLTPQQLFEVARMDEVNFIDRWSDYEVDMDIGREIGGANYIESVAGYTGEGVRGESFDTGFNLNHVDFQAHPLIIHGPSCGSDSHGTACVGILFGDGTGNPAARGLLPDGQGIVADYSIIGLEGQSRYDHSGELVQDPYYAVFQTASVGSSRTTQYTTVSADSDAAIFDFDLIHCQSQSNAGDQMSRPQAWAKNMVSGGAVYHYDTLDKSDDMWNYGASIGPASDGRIKPTFAFFYDDILTVGYPGNNDYTYTFGGTSGATPMIAGHFGLFFQMWSEGIFGNAVDPQGTVFENKAHFTTAKAMMINTADQYPFTGTTHDKTRVHQGWGMPDLKNLYDLRDSIYVIDESDVLDPFEVSTYLVSVESGSPFLKVTMTYADLPGNPAVQSQHRINDLTLKAISPSGTTYWGNNGLYEGVWSTPEGDPDTKNTVECIYIENPEQGSWAIKVSADELIEDSHVETTQLDADYSLVITPMVSVPDPPTVQGTPEVKIEQQYTFSFLSNDPEQRDLYYYIDWGDGTYENWTGPQPSGQRLYVDHAWFEKGEFQITAKAKNTIGAESDWSNPYNVTVLAPALEIQDIAGGLGISAKILNNGSLEVFDVSWSITLDGGLIIIGRETTGELTKIVPTFKPTIETGFILGFGATTITITANDASETATALILGPFVLNVQTE